MKPSLNMENVMELINKLNELEQKVLTLEKEKEELKAKLKKLERRIEDLDYDLDFVYEVANLR